MGCEYPVTVLLHFRLGCDDGESSFLDIRPSVSVYPPSRINLPLTNR